MHDYMRIHEDNQADNRIFHRVVNVHFALRLEHEYKGAGYSAEKGINDVCDDTLLAFVIFQFIMRHDYERKNYTYEVTVDFILSGLPVCGSGLPVDYS